jgi:hypothetical protein
LRLLAVKRAAIRDLSPFKRAEMADLNTAAKTSAGLI